MSIYSLSAADYNESTLDRDRLGVKLKGSITFIAVFSLWPALLLGPVFTISFLSALVLIAASP